MPTELDPISDHGAAAGRDVVQVYPSASGSVASFEASTRWSRQAPSLSWSAPSGGGQVDISRVLSGLERPAVGEVWLGGRATSHLSGRQRLRIVAQEVGYVFQRPGDNVLEYLTVLELVRMAASLRSSRANSVDEVLNASGLELLRGSRAGGSRPASSSGGVRHGRGGATLARRC